MYIKKKWGANERASEEFAVARRGMGESGSDGESGREKCEQGVWGNYRPSVSGFFA